MRVQTFLLLLFLFPALVCGCNKKQAEEEESPSRTLPPLHKEPEKSKKARDKPKVADAKNASYLAAKDGKVYHKRGCIYALHLDSPVGFNTMRDAETSGRIPCVFCLGGQEQEPPPPAPSEKSAPEKSAPGHRSK